MRRIHFTLPERERDGEASMALLAGGMCGVWNDSCSRKHKYARTSHRMASESLSRGVDLFFAQEFFFIKQEHGPPKGSKQAKTDVLLTTVVGPLRGCLIARSSWTSRGTSCEPRGATSCDRRNGGRTPHKIAHPSWPCYGTTCWAARSRRGQIRGMPRPWKPWQRGAAVREAPGGGDLAIVVGFSRQRLVVTSWRLRGDTHTACVATKSPTGATGKMRRTHQRSTWPYRNAAKFRIYLLAKFDDQFELYCSSYERC